jgi:AraC-like DNA-binding protein
MLPTILFVSADWPAGVASSVTVERFGRIVPVSTILEGAQKLAERTFGLVIVDHRHVDEDLRPLLRAAKARRCNVLVAADPPDRRRQARAPSAIQALIDRAANALASQYSAEVRPLGRCVGQAVEQIRAGYRAPLTVSTIAKAIHVSPSHLAHRFRSETGMTVKEYVTRVRVEMAQRLLLETNAKLESIADAVGFCDAPHLSRVFVQYTRQRPGEYRRQPA